MKYASFFLNLRADKDTTTTDGVRKVSGWSRSGEEGEGFVG